MTYLISLKITSHYVLVTSFLALGICFWGRFARYNPGNPPLYTLYIACPKSGEQLPKTNKYCPLWFLNNDSDLVALDIDRFTTSLKVGVHISCNGIYISCVSLYWFCLFGLVLFWRLVCYFLFALFGFSESMFGRWWLVEFNYWTLIGLWKGFVVLTKSW